MGTQARWKGAKEEGEAGSLAVTHHNAVLSIIVGRRGLDTHTRLGLARLKGGARSDTPTHSFP